MLLAAEKAGVIIRTFPTVGFDNRSLPALFVCYLDALNTLLGKIACLAVASDIPTEFSDRFTEHNLKIYFSVTCPMFGILSSKSP